MSALAKYLSFLEALVQEKQSRIQAQIEIVRLKNFRNWSAGAFEGK